MMAPKKKWTASMINKVRTAIMNNPPLATAAAPGKVSEAEIQKVLENPAAFYPQTQYKSDVGTPVYVPNNAGRDTPLTELRRGLQAEKSGKSIQEVSAIYADYPGMKKTGTELLTGSLSLEKFGKDLQKSAVRPTNVIIPAKKKKRIY